MCPDFIGLIVNNVQKTDIRCFAISVGINVKKADKQR